MATAADKIDRNLFLFFKEKNIQNSITTLFEAQIREKLKDVNFHSRYDLI